MAFRGCNASIQRCAACLRCHALKYVWNGGHVAQFARFPLRSTTEHNFQHPNTSCLNHVAMSSKKKARRRPRDAFPKKSVGWFPQRGRRVLGVSPCKMPRGHPCQGLRRVPPALQPGRQDAPGLGKGVSLVGETTPPPKQIRS